MIAHPIPRGSTVVATPALSPPQWPNGTSLTIHVDAQYELFNRACAAAGIGANSNKNGKKDNITLRNLLSLSIYTLRIECISIDNYTVLQRTQRRKKQP